MFCSIRSAVNEFHSMQDIVKLKLKLKFLIETTDDLFSISQHDLSSFHHFYDHIEETSTKVVIILYV